VSYQVGDTYPATLAIDDASGDPVDPATLTLRVRDALGAWTTTVYPASPIAKTATGRYNAPVPLTSGGEWVIQWTTTGPAASEWKTVYVAASPLDGLPIGLSLDGLKLRLGGRELDDSVADDTLNDYLTAAVDQAQAPWPWGCGRTLTQGDADESRVLELTAGARIDDGETVGEGRVRIPDASTLTSVTINGSAITAYRTVRKDGYVVQATGFDAPTTTTREATVVGRFGFSVVPRDLADAIYVLAARYSYEAAAMYADNVAVLEGDAAKVYYRQLPVRTKMVFQRYMVPDGIVGLR
jgi:hypothetical protein